MLCLDLPCPAEISTSFTFKGSVTVSLGSLFKGSELLCKFSVADPFSDGFVGSLEEAGSCELSG